MSALCLKKERKRPWLLMAWAINHATRAALNSNHVGVWALISIYSPSTNNKAVNLNWCPIANLWSLCHQHWKPCSNPRNHKILEYIALHLDIDENGRRFICLQWTLWGKGANYFINKIPSKKKKKKKRNFGLRRRPTWIKCLFDPPPIQCPQDKGMEVKIYSPLSRVDTLVTSNQ